MDTEQRLKELERRRLRGARLLNSGTHPAEVARQVRVSRQSVMRWERALKESGVQGLERVEAPGRPRRLSEEQLKELAKILKAGAAALCPGSEPGRVHLGLSQVSRHAKLLRP